MPLYLKSVCPNCGTYNQFGFGNVCVKFKTFVCDLCKSSHQAISHRCKSITMSTWTMEEVQELIVQRCGGNHAALQTWLLHAPNCGERYDGGRRPKVGDKIEIFKKFIEDCYERQMFKSSTPFIPSEMKLSRVTDTSPPKKSSSVSNDSGLRSTKGKVVAAAVPVLDLLDMGSAPTQDLFTPAVMQQPTQSIDFFSQPQANTPSDVFRDWTGGSAQPVPASASTNLLDLMMAPSSQSQSSSINRSTSMTGLPISSGAAFPLIQPQQHMGFNTLIQPTMQVPMMPSNGMHNMNGSMMGSAMPSLPIGMSMHPGPSMMHPISAMGSMGGPPMNHATAYPMMMQPRAPGMHAMQTMQPNAFNQQPSIGLNLNIPTMHPSMSQGYSNMPSAGSLQRSLQQTQQQKLQPQQAINGKPNGLNSFDGLRW